MGGGSLDKDFEDDVHAQSLLALEHADLILFVVNGREEITASDYAVAEVLRQKRKKHVPVLLLIAKCDDAEKTEEAIPRFYELGITDDVFPVSAAHNIGIEEVQDAISLHLTKMHFGPRKKKEEDVSEEEEDRKSTRLNSSHSQISYAV